MSRLLLLVLLLAAPALAAPVPKQVLSAEQVAEFNALWDSAAWSPTNGVRLYCRLIGQPDAAVEYLSKHVPPAAMSEKEAKELLTALASDDADVWKPAYRALDTRDIRLALTPEIAWNEHDGRTFRQRLGTLLLDPGRSPEHVRVDADFSLRPPDGVQADWQLVEKSNAHPRGLQRRVHQTFAAAEAGPGNWSRKGRAVIATAALERIGTPAARKHLEALASGDDAGIFTVEAKAVVHRFTSPRDPLGEKPATMWKWELSKFTSPEAVDRLLAVPKDTLPLFKEKLMPLTLTKKDGEKLLTRLFSDEAKEVQAALREIQYYDLRLAMSVEQAWEEAKTPTHRGRIVSAMWLQSVMDFDLSRVDEQHRLLDYTYHPPDAEFDGWHATTRLRAGLSDDDVRKAVGVGGSTRVDNTLADKHSKWGAARWRREESAIYILDAIGTDDAIAIIKDMATGHADAGPTKAAREVLKRRGVK
jgi:hypothetical protein